MDKPNVAYYNIAVVPIKEGNVLRFEYNHDSYVYLVKKVKGSIEGGRTLTLELLRTSCNDQTIISTFNQLELNPDTPFNGRIDDPDLRAADTFATPTDSIADQVALMDIIVGLVSAKPTGSMLIKEVVDFLVAEKHISPYEDKKAYIKRCEHIRLLIHTVGAERVISKGGYYKLTGLYQLKHKTAGYRAPRANLTTAFDQIREAALGVGENDVREINLYHVSKCIEHLIRSGLLGDPEKFKFTHAIK
jgi:hypothetical protein